MPESVPVTIYHNPACGTSRNTLALIRNAGIEPTIIEYLKTPPDRATLESLIQRMGIRPRDLLRQKGTPYDELGLGADHWTDAQLIDQMLDASHSDQSTDRGDALGRQVVPPIRGGFGHSAAPSERTVCERRRGAADRRSRSPHHNLIEFNLP